MYCNFTLKLSVNAAVALIKLFFYLHYWLLYNNTNRSFYKKKINERKTINNTVYMLSLNWFNINFAIQEKMNATEIAQNLFS